MEPYNRHDEQSAGDDERLSLMFEAYREACPDPEASANFMPLLWQRIEARERFSMAFGRLARNLVTAALAVTTLLALAVSIEHSRMATLPKQTYVEVLAEDHARQNLDYFEPLRIEPIADQH